MNLNRIVRMSAFGFAVLAGFGISLKGAAAADVSESTTVLDEGNLGVNNSTVIDLTELTAHPENYDFFTFRPNLEKLILSGTADTEHISILWYTVPNGSVGLHYHAMTESVYTIEGSQTDAQGTYPTGSLYFNPPGSGHEIRDSSGFFILAYAAPPDFVNTDLIEPYTPIQINTAEPNLQDAYPFIDAGDGIQIYDVPLDPDGGMSSRFISSTSSESYEYAGNYLLVLEGQCNIDGTAYGKNMLIVATTVEAQTYQVSAAAGQSCLSVGLSFETTTMSRGLSINL